MVGQPPAKRSIIATAVTVVANLLPLWDVWFGDLVVGPAFPLPVGTLVEVALRRI